MRQTVIVAYDDFDWVQNKIRTPADETVVVQLNIELDLTAARAQQVREYVDLLQRAGQPIGGGTESKRGRGNGTTKRGTALTEVGYARKYGQEMRAWADARGRTDEYRTPGGHISPRKSLKDDFATWVEQTGWEPS